MKRNLPVLVLSTLVGTLFATHLAAGADKGDPVAHYRSSTQLDLITCRLKAKSYYMIASLHHSSPEAPDIEAQSLENVRKAKAEYLACVRDAKSDAKPLFDAATKYTKKGPAREALKSYQVAYIIALDGVEAEDGETKSAYARRQQALTTRLEEAWVRFEVEQ